MLLTTEDFLVSNTKDELGPGNEKFELVIRLFLFQRLYFAVELLFAKLLIQY